jgi:hypothetical protein
VFVPWAAGAARPALNRPRPMPTHAAAAEPWATNRRYSSAELKVTASVAMSLGSATCPGRK